jgi:hypothetical protein
VFAGKPVECVDFKTTSVTDEARVLTSFWCTSPADAVVAGRRTPTRKESNAGMTNPRLCFVDSVGTDWRIYEVASANVPAPRGRNCLIFESTQAVRRVWNYPNNWHNLTSDELSALSWNT